MQSQLQVIKAKSGDFIFTLNGNPIQNPEDPKAFAKTRLEDNKIPGDVNHLIIYGFDFGYTAEACLELYDNPQVYVFEPSEVIYKIAASTRGDLRKNPNFHAFTTIDGLEAALMTNFKRGETIYTIALDTWKNWFSEEYAKFDEKTHATIRNIYLSENSKDARYGEWSKNVLLNLPKHIENPDLMPLIRKVSGVPAVVCSAGPSLSKNIKLLKKLQDKVVIICVNTAYKALLANGITPHFVATIESYNVAAMFKGLDVKDTNLISPLVAHPSLQDLPFSRHLTYSHAPSFYNEWSAAKLNDKVHIDIGGSVACSAFATAYMLGANPIILIGQDLAFTDGKMYSAGTKYEKEKVVIDEEAGTIIREVKKDVWEASGKKDFAKTVTGRVQYAKGWHGGKVITIDDFKFFISWFESASKFLKSADPQRRIINATEGGVYLEGYEHLPLKQVIKKFKFLKPHYLKSFIKKLPPKGFCKEPAIKELTYLLELVNREDKTTEDLIEEIDLFNAYTRLSVKNKEDLEPKRQEFKELLEETLNKILI